MIERCFPPFVASENEAKTAPSGVPAGVDCFAELRITRGFNQDSTVTIFATATVPLPPEVRLRKLHLVRSDLIQYPICYEVYC